LLYCYIDILLNGWMKLCYSTINKNKTIQNKTISHPCTNLSKLCYLRTPKIKKP
jgi:hypothetical protein